jgi:hypothetical protein
VTRARVLPALFFAVVWLLGYEVVPCAHLAMHARLGAHEHGAGAMHCHDGGCHADPRAGAPAHRAPRSHGAGSLEHRGVAALVPDLAIHLPEAAVVGELALPTPLADRDVVFALASPPARGPPA